MFIDTRSLPDNEEIGTDVCIIGAGAAGIAIARELIGSPLRVCLLESGGFDYDERTHELNRVDNVGERELNLESFRARWFGGTTNLWGGNCSPLDPIDFEKRDWIPLSGWPIGREELEPYYRRAHPYFELGTRGYDPQEWAAAFPEFSEVRLDVGNTPVVEKLYQRSPRTKFGIRYRDDFRPPASNVTVLLNASAMKLATDESGRTVTAVRAGTLDGRRITIVARYVVLAAGIENARLLLLSNDRHPAGLGNGYDTVGRYFMEHISLISGEVVLPDAPGFLKYYDIENWAPPSSPERPDFCVGLQPRAGEQARERMGNYVAFLTQTFEGTTDPGFQALRHIIGQIKRGHWPDGLASDIATMMGDMESVLKGGYARLSGRGTRIYQIQHFLEQTPDPDSRIRLGDGRDALGLPRMEVAWRFNDLDRRTLVRGQELVMQALGIAGLGRVRPDYVSADEPWPETMHQSSHYMGTTRMSDDPKLGVVDRDCRVHGLSNLFVAGGSVLPTAGCAMVTINIVTLALRLADRIRMNFA